MILLAFFQWWFGPGWAEQIKAIPGRAQSLAAIFSISILLRTLFAPWKQITSTVHTDQSIQIKMHAGIDNIISRFVGFAVRLIVLLIACVLIVISSVLSLAIAIIWPMLPAMVLFVIPLGFTL